MILTDGQRLTQDEEKILLQLVNQASFQGGILEVALALKKKLEAAQPKAPTPPTAKKKEAAK